MHCKVCNTRLGTGERTCPNCGNDAGPGVSFSRASKPGRLPKKELEDSSDEVELELNDVTGDQPAPAKARPAARKKPRTEKAAPAKAAKPAGSAPLFSPDPAGLHALLQEQPDTLEPGLSIYGGDKGTTSGVSYDTPVGEIDLLCKSKQGDLVVVMIMEKTAGEELVAEILKRLGWVRKHLAEAEGAKVRGIVLCPEAPEDLSYTAAAVADTVSFKTYRVALTFDDVEI